MTATSTASRGWLRQRRLEVERRLAERGLLRGPRRIPRGRHPGGGSPRGGHPRGGHPQAAAEVVELRRLLEELGPVFVAFGRYLSLRADLLRATDCLALRELDEQAEPSSLEAVDGRILEQLGRPRAELFPVFEHVPFEVRWLDQAHRARLESGERVVVRIVHPGRRQEILRELEALPALRGAVAALCRDDGFPGAAPSSREHFSEVVDDFRRQVVERLDLAAQADGLQILGRDARRDELLVVPEVYRDVSAAGVLTVQWLPGQTLAEIAALPGLQAIDAYDLARRVGLLWLQTTLVGHRFPVEADLLELPDGRLAVTGGSFAELPDASRVRLWNYLRATVEHFPDRAAASLLREVTPLDPEASRGELRARVRQVVPFRDGAWSATGESLGEYAVLHWRLLRGVGFKPRRHLDAFYQGLFWAAGTARRLAPQKDPLGEAVRDFDWLAGWNQLRQLAAPRQLAATAESYVQALAELPQKLDRVLSLATGDGFRLPASRPRKRRRSNAVVAVICLGLAMAAVAWLATDLRLLGGAVGLSAAGTERALAAVYLGLGLTLLTAVRRLR